MFTKFKLSHLCAMILVFMFSLSFKSSKSQNAIGMQLLIPVEAQIDSNQVKVRSPFSDEESIKEEIYTESHYIKREKIKLMTNNKAIKNNGEARKEKVVTIVHYL